jgi:3-deoxy-D-manno-octulosonate 8-phosphate phosphatase (KDO 8-P phosphatase)
LTDIEKIFIDLGGEFQLDFSDFLLKLDKVKAILFDWDGVFNSGVKIDQTGSSFSEVDSMGINLMRFGFWLKNNQLPLCGIITGENNQVAFYLAQRECFHSVYYKFKNKTEAFNHLLEQHHLEADEVAYVFDDVLDLSIAQECGLRFLVRQPASPLLNDYIKANGLCDYITRHSGIDHAVREICELTLGAMGMFTKVVEERIAFSELYSSYLSERQNILPHFFTFKDNQIIQNTPASKLGF